MVECVRCDLLKNVGPMNRRVEVWDVTEDQDEHGQPIETEVFERNWRADVRYMRGLERFRSNQELAEMVAIFTGRWFPNLTATKRFHFDDMVWDIEGIAPIGRRAFLEVTAKVVRA